MELKQRLQRVLQILEDSERAGAISDLEKDIVLADLREAYSEVKFGNILDERQEVRDESVAPVLPVSELETNESEEDVDEPEMEFEIIFNEEDDEEEIESGESKVENETETETETATEPETETVVAQEIEIPIAEQPIEQPEVVEVEQPIIGQSIAEQPIIEERKTVAEELASAYDFQRSTPTRSAILSLYEDAAPVVGEQFREQPSVADVIACPKGVAEVAPVTSLRNAIGVADKFMLIRELFDGDVEAYDAAIDSLEGINSFEDCVIFITENFSWRAQSEGTKFMMELLQRKFNA